MARGASGPSRAGCRSEVEALIGGRGRDSVYCRGGSSRLLRDRRVVVGDDRSGRRPGGDGGRDVHVDFSGFIVFGGVNLGLHGDLSLDVVLGVVNNLLDEHVAPKPMQLGNVGDGGGRVRAVSIRSTNVHRIRLLVPLLIFGSGSDDIGGGGGCRTSRGLVSNAENALLCNIACEYLDCRGAL